jgi:hypothetical protein
MHGGFLDRVLHCKDGSPERVLMRRMMLMRPFPRGWGAFFIIALGAAGGCAVADAPGAQFGQTSEAVIDGTALTQAERDATPAGKVYAGGLGTGTLIGCRHLVATAGHVVDGVPLDQITFYPGNNVGDIRGVSSVTVVGTGWGDDLAFLVLAADAPDSHGVAAVTYSTSSLSYGTQGTLYGVGRRVANDWSTAGTLRSGTQSFVEIRSTTELATRADPNASASSDSGGPWMFGNTTYGVLSAGAESLTVYTTFAANSATTSEQILNACVLNHSSDEYLPLGCWDTCYLYWGVRFKGVCYCLANENYQCSPQPPYRPCDH